MEDPKENKIKIFFAKVFLFIMIIIVIILITLSYLQHKNTKKYCGSSNYEYFKIDTTNYQCCKNEWVGKNSSGEWVQQTKCIDKIKNET